MTNKEIAKAFEDLFNQWTAAKVAAKCAHPDWTEEQVNNAVQNAFMAEFMTV